MNILEMIDTQMMMMSGAMYAVLSVAVLVSVKYAVKKRVMLRTVMFIEHKPSLRELDLSHGSLFVAVGAVFVLLASSWLVVPVMAVGVFLWVLRYEVSASSLLGV